MSKVNDKVLPIREIFKVTPKEFLYGFKTNVNVLYEDNVAIYTAYKELVLQRYLYSLFALVPELRIESKYAISNFYTNGMYTSKTINKCLEVMFENIVNQVVKPTGNRDILDSFFKNVFEIINNIYNEYVYEHLEYVSSINIKDFLEIQFDERLIKSLQDVNIERTPEAVNKTYEILDDVFRNKESVKDNPLTKAYISGTANPNQMKQMLGSIGYRTEIDGSIFKYPIASSYTLGMQDIYDISTESRGGAKALFLSHDAIKESEYFARELQLVTMVVEKVVPGDCGSKEYIDWLVRSEERYGKSDLPNLIGSYYLNEETGLEEPITMEHKHLEGKVIKLRNSLKCELEDKRCICSKCFGDLFYSIFPHTNVGHYSTTELMQIITQSILSTKHLTSSATTGELVLDDTSKQFFNVKSKNFISFKANLVNKVRYDYKIIISQQDAFGIKDLTVNTDANKLNPTRVSLIESFILRVTDNVGVITDYPIFIKDGSKRGSFTVPFLKYIIENGTTIDDRDRYIIDVNGWTTTEPIIVMPEIEFNFIDLAKSIKSIFKFMKLDDDRASNEKPEAVLQRLFDAVMSRLNVNIAWLSVIVYAFTVYDSDNDNYDIGRNGSNVKMSRIHNVLSGRSLGSAYAWETVTNFLVSPRSFVYGKASHPLDVMLRPNDVLKDQSILK